MDTTSVRFRARTVHAGILLTISCCLSALLYFALTWDHEHRPLMAIGVAIVILGSLPLTRVDLDELLRGRKREPFFLAWSFTVIVVIAAMAALDGGDRSPITAALFLPLAFGSLTYPLRSMLVVGATVIAAYVVVAIVGHEHELGRVAFWMFTLGNATWMCAWQARNHDLQHAEITRISRADPLTGCLNRRGFEERMEAELARATRSGLPVGLILLDLDHFKAVNDSRGHAAGDDLLRWTVATTLLALRPMDALGRVGGDEFAILAPGAGADDALEVAERLSATLADRAPVSYGIATFPADGEHAAGLHQHADVELYAMKRGRVNRPAAGDGADRALSLG
jgi:diguanylate cyclase (GGDEF)-like protein